MYCTVSYFSTVQYSTTCVVIEQAECLRTDAIKTLNFPFPDYKAPLAPKRELLAIPQGWRHKLQAKKKDHIGLGLDWLPYQPI